MKKRIIATVLTAACALTGCSTSVPDLSKLDAGKASEYMAGELLKQDRKSTRLNSSHITRSRMPSSA